MPQVDKLRIINNFANSKNQCLGKRDKSSAGRIDPHAVDICGVINALPCYYTTSSCAGRCFLYRGPGIKSTENFERFRVSHDKIVDPQRYFDLSTLDTDPTGGGDPIRSIGQFEHSEKIRRGEEIPIREGEMVGDVTVKSNEETDVLRHDTLQATNTTEGDSIWLRFEPFILHVACRSLKAASDLMNAARPAFKNVGLTTWKDSRYLVAIWGDEGLEMPLCTADSRPFIVSGDDNHIGSLSPALSDWLAQLVNDRHERNWKKIERFVQLVRDITPFVDAEDIFESSVAIEMGSDDADVRAKVNKFPRAYDVIGDIALIHSLEVENVAERKEIGEAIMGKNKGIKVVAVRQSNLNGTERAPGQDGISVIAGADRDPLMTSHVEYGIKCIVDLRQTFFSPRMGPERLRICQQVARGEHVLVLFAGVAMEALQIAGRTEASSVTAIELNEVAVNCARRSHQALARNKGVKCVGAAERLEIRQGDALEILPTLPKNHYDRVLAPRPKEGALDGDLGAGDGGVQFLQALLPVLKQEGGECHWYDFVADHEFPDCKRTRRLLESICQKNKLGVEILHVARVGSVAMRQYRVCLDFRIVAELE